MKQRQKAKDHARKKLAAIEKAKAREEDPEETARYREKAKLKKREQRKAEKIRKWAAGVQKLNTPEKRKIKTLKQRIKRQLKILLRHAILDILP